MAKTSTASQNMVERRIEEALGNQQKATPRVLPIVPTTANKLRRIGEDETFSTTVKMVEPGRYECSFAVRPDGGEKSPRYAVTSLFDFRSASPDEVAKLALRGAIIDVQRNFRAAHKSNAETAINAAQWANVNVKTDIVDAARKSADPVARAVGMARKTMTPAQLRALADELEGSTK